MTSKFVGNSSLLRPTPSGMSNLWVTLLAILGCLDLVGCSGSTPLICDGLPSDPPACRPDGGTTCTTDTECSPQVCDLGTNTCVECTADNTSMCIGTSPVCEDSACRRCAAHSECPSQACLPDGSCANPDDVAYAVDGASLGTALEMNRPILKISGTVEGTVTLKDRNLVILADPGAKLKKTNQLNVAVLTIDGTSNVAIYDLEVTGGSFGNAGIHIVPSVAVVSLERVSVVGGGVVAEGTTLSVRNSTFSGSFNAGISTSGSSLTVAESVIANNARGITTSGGSVSISRSNIVENSSGGIVLQNGSFEVTNNVIARNGDNLFGDSGGIAIIGGASGGSRIEFNTIVDNRLKSSATGGGISCNIGGFQAANNVIARNSINGDTVVAGAQTTGSCTYPSSKIQADLSGLLFVSADASPFDYHLQVGSSLIDQAVTMSDIDIDIDGDARPTGSASDIGADEFVP